MLNAKSKRYFASTETTDAGIAINVTEVPLESCVGLRQNVVITDAKYVH